MQEMIDKLSSDSMRFICLKKCDKILANQKYLSKYQIIDVVADLRDEIERYC